MIMIMIMKKYFKNLLQLSVLTIFLPFMIILGLIGILYIEDVGNMQYPQNEKK